MSPQTDPPVNDAAGNPGSAPTSRADRTAALDIAVARLLSTGTLLAVGLLVVGVVLMAGAGRSPSEEGFLPLDLARLPSDLAALRPEGFLWLGLLAVILTPISRVTASLVGFLRDADRVMTVTSVAILGVIAGSVVISSLVK